MTSPASGTPNRRIAISTSDWQNRLNDVQVSKGDLNRLVMDYLVVEGYKEAAENFAREAGMNPQTDFDSIQNRMTIRNAIQRGDIVEAIERVNDLNPEILDNNPALYFQLQQQRLIELIRQKRIDEALYFAQEELAPRGEEHPEFLSDLEQTMTLLAYDVDLAALEEKYRSINPPAADNSSNNIAHNEDIDGVPSFVASLLHPAHRQATAARVNAAILTSQSHGPTPKLPNLLRMLAWGENLLSDKLEFPKMDILVSNPREAASKREREQQQQQDGTGQAKSSSDVAMMDEESRRVEASLLGATDMPMAG